MTQVDQSTPVATTAGLSGYFSQLLQQLGVVALVTLGFAGVAGRIDARLPGQGIDFKPRVIGQRRQAADTASLTRLEQRILDKGESGFLDVDHTKIRLRTHTQPQVGEQLTKLTDLAWITAGQNQLIGRVHAGASQK